ncbi:hypothetical protein [Calidifontibacter indicus]|uniref:Uncharacterized protein n=1 Tax=Calidifontibacter indicus TaxID=419650 RepID=A0A3D9UKR8_9MICO|nr:hypothetical protein [Calidifontibacter indicus]REF29919.1 hypothetical protein DFJ65_0903 [Calidifontibacter indicus]
MSDFLGFGSNTWRAILAVGCVLAAGFLVGATTEVTEHDWAGMAYLALIAVGIMQLVWRGRHLARRDRLR